jgi:hypothetical protein
MLGALRGSPLTSFPGLLFSSHAFRFAANTSNECESIERVWFTSIRSDDDRHWKLWHPGKKQGCLNLSSARSAYQQKGHSFSVSLFVQGDRAHRPRCFRAQSKLGLTHAIIHLIKRSVGFLSCFHVPNHHASFLQFV